MERVSNIESICPVSRKRWMCILYKNRKNLSNSFGYGLMQLFNKAGKLKIKAVSLHIIYLRTSIYNKRPYYRLYLFDEKLYNGNTDCWVYWEMAEIIAYMELIFPIVNEEYCIGYKYQIGSQEKKIKESVENLHLVVDEMIGYFINSVVKQFPQIRNYPVYLGEYMNEQQLIYDGRIG